MSQQESCKTRSRLLATLGLLKYEVQLVKNLYGEYDKRYKLIVELDQELGDYYHSTIPPVFGRVRKQLHQTHVSVVRNEVPPNLECWGKYKNQIVVIYFDHYVHQDETYFWLNAYSEGLEQIRMELGLPNSSQWTKPPSGFDKCFHITIANKKGMI